MSKKNNPNQYSLEPLFFEVPPKIEVQTGSLDVSLAVREILTETLSKNPLDRYEIAVQMSRLMARDMSKNMLDRYSAPSAEEWRFPLEALPALVSATGDFRLLELIAEKCGCKLLRGEEAWIAEVGALTLQKKQTEKRLSEFKGAVPEDVLVRLSREVLKRIGGSHE
jgi:hypothetical protein